MMAESPNQPDQPKDAAAEPAAEAAPPDATGEAPAQAETPEAAAQAAETATQAGEPGNPPVADSLTFSRCAECKNAEEVNSAAGTLVCKKHNMLINAEADEIPDDCVEYEAKDGECGVT